MVQGDGPLKITSQTLMVCVLHLARAAALFDGGDALLDRNFFGVEHGLAETRAVVKHERRHHHLERRKRASERASKSPSPTQKQENKHSIFIFFKKARASKEHLSFHRQAKRISARTIKKKKKQASPRN
jgi:hypothetical protein